MKCIWSFTSIVCTSDFIIPLVIYWWCSLWGIFGIWLHLFAMTLILIYDKTLYLEWKDPLVISYIVSIILTIILATTWIIET